MKEAVLYHRLDNQRVACDLCHHRCIIPEGQRGKCGVRSNDKGILYSLNYGKTISVAADPIEKKPLSEYMPGTKTYSLAAEGCNMSCLWCQNYEISQCTKQDLSAKRTVRGARIKPSEHVQKALEWGCRSVSYTYSEPTVFFEYAVEIMRKASFAGLKNIWVTNGFMTSDALELLLPQLDAVNVDLKAYREDVYRHYCDGHLQPVLDNIRTLFHAGVHVEVTTLIVTDVNDDEAQLRGIARYIASELGTDVPWHISRFFPTWQLTDRSPTSIETIHRAQQWGREEGLQKIFLGNVVR